MSMLASFFDIRRQSRAYFEGLDIMNNPELCAAWMNQYPALFLTFKDVDGLDYASAKQMLRTQIAGLYGEHAYLKTSSNISENDRKVYEQLADVVDGAADRRHAENEHCRAHADDAGALRKAGYPAAG